MKVNFTEEELNNIRFCINTTIQASDQATQVAKVLTPIDDKIKDALPEEEEEDNNKE